MRYASVRGMDDMLPQDAWLWQDIERKARVELEFYGYKEIRTPILEDTAVFVRGIGETTDIVTKEMFTFSDRKERSLTLRPEGTAPIVRAYIEHSMDSLSSVQRLYYMGPMFRAERPQKGRLRQFHQIGVEVIGTNSPFADVEVLVQLSGMLSLFGLADSVIKLNSLGCKDDKAKFADNLKAFLSDKKNMLCDDCKARMDKNVLRVLDCKNDACSSVARLAPGVAELLCVPCKDHFDKVKNSLNAAHVKFEETANLVRGLDYYTGTVFEVTHPSLGGQDAIGAGGRYDNLVKDMGGAAVGAIGYALGIERMLIAIKAGGPKHPAAKIIYIATLGDEAKIGGMRLAEKIKKGLPGVIVLKDISEASLKSQMRLADKSGAGAVIILGSDELKAGSATIKDMRSNGPQVSIPADSVIDELRRILC